MGRSFFGWAEPPTAANVNARTNSAISFFIESLQTWVLG